MLNQTIATTPQVRENEVAPYIILAPDMTKVRELHSDETQEVLNFLTIRPVHTVVMTSFINDNGIVSELNRGKFYGYRNSEGQLQGVALIGHSTLVEARSEDALKALAFTAQSSETPIHLVMSSGDEAATFWKYMTSGTTQPRLTCTEALFEISFPFAVQKSDWKVENASLDLLIPVAEAQAEVAFIECGVDPMLRDREGFLKRVARRIEQNRVFVVRDGEKLVFKADIIAETDDVIYLEGVYVAPEYRGRGIGPNCLSTLSLELLNRVSNICMLSNVEFEGAHKSFLKAGFRNTDQCTTLFV
ncbi:GNAT family N-acetyltransferase [soil metagenome]